MAVKIYSCSYSGLEGQIIEVEADIAQGMPAFNIVGLGDTSVQESRQRVRASIKNSGFMYPPTRKTINLAPARLRKHGALFDLPIALSILIASKQLAVNSLDNSIIVGELSLNGEVKSIPGAILIAQIAKENGFKRIFLPKRNAVEASFIKEIEIIPVKNLKQIVNHLTGKELINPMPKVPIKIPKSNDINIQLLGLESAKRALAIAASGGHNVLLIGNPGCGKTVISRAFKDLQPIMTEEEVIETTKIYSVAGMIDAKQPLVIKRPFREVHHTASAISIIGGGSQPKPGEISLAHNGILFLDEIAEFPRKVLETLRQPMEDKFIRINRLHNAYTFPSNFNLIATMNRCPCGYFGDQKVRCICTDTQVKNYQKKLSGPLLDRFDIFLTVKKTPIGELMKKEKGDIVELISKIQNAYCIQEKRYRGLKDIKRNSDLKLSEITKYCTLDPKLKSLLKKAANNLNLSNRAYFKTLKLARTIADFENSEKIELIHLMEALQYREQA